MTARRPVLPPLWVVFFSLFAVAIAQRVLLPPAEHTVAFNVAVFAALALATLAVLATLERRR